MISREDVAHIARLARIELSPDEASSLERELSSILDFIAQLDEVDTAAVEPLTGGTLLENVMREDEGTGGEQRRADRKLVEAAPKERDGYIEVKAVFDRGQ